MAHARHKAPPRTPRLDPRSADVVVALAGAALLALTAIGAASSSPSDEPTPPAQAQPATSLTTMLAPTTDELSDLRDERDDARLRVARGAERPAPTDIAPAPVITPTVAPLPTTTTAYTTVTVNVRAAASGDSPVLAVLELGAEVAVTGQSAGGYAEVVHDGELAWVYSAYVADTPPPSADPGDGEPTTGGGVSGAPCPSGSGVESGLSSNGVAVHRAVCALFPGVSSYGGVRPGDGGEHGSGHALDIMVSTALGDEIAAYLQAHYAELGIRELIWRQRIWSTDRASDGWRWMEDRGSATANHYDHVHVTVT